MINHPVTFQRDFQVDLHPERIQAKSQDTFIEKCQRVALAILPLLTLNPSVRAPLSFGMSGVRSIAHGREMIAQINSGNHGEGFFHFVHASLATSAFGLFFFNPVLCYLASTVSDAIIHSRAIIESSFSKDYKALSESMTMLSIDFLFLLSFCYGSIEITVGCFLMQIAFGIYKSCDQFKQGNYLESISEGILATARIREAMPQIRLLQWKIHNKPVLSGELKQDKRGFAYIDVRDEMVYSLYKTFNNGKSELPPYFGKGKAGAHITLVIPQESQNIKDIPIKDLGKKFSFTVVSVTSVKPDSMNDVNKVHFLTVRCSQAESFRSSLGLTPKIRGHDFHITFALEK